MELYGSTWATVTLPVVGAAAAAVLALANSVIDFGGHSPWWFFDRGLATLKRYQDNLNKNIKDGVKPNTPVVTQELLAGAWNDLHTGIVGALNPVDKQSDLQHSNNGKLLYYLPMYVYGMTMPTGIQLPGTASLQDLVANMYLNGQLDMTYKQWPDSPDWNPASILPLLQQNKYYKANAPATAQVVQGQVVLGQDSAPAAKSGGNNNIILLVGAAIATALLLANKKS